MNRMLIFSEFSIIISQWHHITLYYSYWRIWNSLSFFHFLLSAFIRYFVNTFLKFTNVLKVFEIEYSYNITKKFLKNVGETAKNMGHIMFVIVCIYHSEIGIPSWHLLFLTIIYYSYIRISAPSLLVLLRLFL